MPQLCESIMSQLGDLIAAIGMSHLLPGVCAEIYRREWTHGQPHHVCDYIDVQFPSHDQVAIVLDKNVKRMAFADKLGYFWRLAQNHFDDPEHYVFCGDESGETLFQRRLHLFEKYIPEKWRMRCPEVERHQLQHAYINYKNKCHHQAGGLACGKTHAHDREIVSDFLNPHKRFLKLVARSIRIAKISSKEKAWTVWKQADLKQEILQRVAALHSTMEFRSECPCGKHKTRELQVVKLDASQFFKAASVDRGVKRVVELLERVEQNTGKDAVAIYRLPYAKGNLCSGRKH